MRRQPCEIQKDVLAPRQAAHVRYRGEANATTILVETVRVSLDTRQKEFTPDYEFVRSLPGAQNSLHEGRPFSLVALVRK